MLKIHYKPKSFRLNKTTIHQLDKIKIDGNFASYNKLFLHLIQLHYQFMDNQLTKEEKEMLRQLTNVREGDICPHCKIGTIVLKRSKYGKFLACNEFPRCAFTQKYEESR
jgi:ssDNA-binding Zn-finger/Zn-ribbon topoisomerase 1